MHSCNSFFAGKFLSDLWHKSVNKFSDSRHKYVKIIGLIYYQKH